MLAPRPDWMDQPDIRTYEVTAFTLEEIFGGKASNKKGYMAKLYRNKKIRSLHMFKTKKEAVEFGEDYVNRLVM
jgi:hypothetical protein